ncbi:hypothetical protein [Salidesulfovibrio onnuriiensis]|uniref:hypothetical protein n=1 Tax=Salidesulfovibrio onnuriiensis TaxID=2583823 RepID=UPI0011CC642E|nr:hypothetical protein [Salidesulfovibrio onnuriiensis]
MPTSRPMLLFTTMFLALLALLPVPGLAADTGNAISFSYRLTAGGQEFGTLQVWRTPAIHEGLEVLAERKSMAIRQAGNHQITSNENALFSRDGSLWQYDAQLKAEDTYAIRVRRRQGDLDIHFKENGKTILESALKADAMDFTSQYLPLDTISPAKPVDYRMFSLGELEVVRTILRKEGDETVRIADMAFPCVILEQDTGSAKSRKWMTRDDNGYWFMVREIIRSEDENYEVVLTEYKFPNRGNHRLSPPAVPAIPVTPHRSSRTHDEARPFASPCPPIPGSD